MDSPCAAYIMDRNGDLQALLGIRNCPQKPYTDHEHTSHTGTQHIATTICYVGTVSSIIEL